jgi:hypothetical protein
MPGFVRDQVQKQEQALVQHFRRGTIKKVVAHST